MAATGELPVETVAEVVADRDAMLRGAEKHAVIQYAAGWITPPSFRTARTPSRRRATESWTQERYTHSDGTSTIIREYRADGSYHIMSDRGEIELVDNANDPYAPTR